MARLTASAAPGRYPIDSGEAELVKDPYRRNAYLVKINGVESSHIDLDDPRSLDFEYMRWMAALVEERFPPGPQTRVRLLHLGAGAGTLARYFAAGYPAGRQVAVELDAQLAERSREWFALPRAPQLRIRVGDARAVTESLHEHSREVVTRDVFADAVTPAALTTVEFVAHVHRVLVPGGVYVVNCGDTRALTESRLDAAAMLTAFSHVAIVADSAMLKGRQRGNVVLAASDSPIGETAGLAHELLGGGVPAQVWTGERVRAFVGTTRPRHDSDSDTDTDGGTDGESVVG